MHSTIESLLATLRSRGDLRVYDRSADAAEGTACAIVSRAGQKYLALTGDRAARFAGHDEGGVRLCPLTVENVAGAAGAVPVSPGPHSHAGHAFTMGLGDRLGLATPGHVRAIAGHGRLPGAGAAVHPRADAHEPHVCGRDRRGGTFGVFQEGYRDGYGADGDHLKTKEEIQLRARERLHDDHARLFRAHRHPRRRPCPTRRWRRPTPRCRRTCATHYEAAYLGQRAAGRRAS